MTWCRRSLPILILVGGVFGIWKWNRETRATWRDLSAQVAAGPVEVFDGITYGCERFDLDVEARGLMHWVRVDLAAPGVDLYVTPLNPEAVARGWQYRLEKTETVVREYQLAVGINGTLFSSQRGVWRRTGDLARSGETAVADHQVNHVCEHTYLLWFDDDLKPHLETTKPPSETALDLSRWGIGGQGVGVLEGAVRSFIPIEPVDSRTAVGIDSSKKLLWLAVFENASPRRALEKLAALGAREGMLLDGGDSSCMVLGDGAQGVPAGVVAGGGRPVATHFGIRANRIGREAKARR